MTEPVVEFVEYKKMDLSGYTLIEGFPGLGLVGTIGVKYLIERMKFEQLGHIETNFFIPIISIRNGLPVYPSRIFVHRGKKLVAIISEQIIPKMMVRHVAKAIVKWIEKKGIKQVISLEGIRSKGEFLKTETVYGIADSEAAKELLKKHNVTIVMDGITTGVTALILLELSQNDKISSCSLLGNVQIAADYEAAAECLKRLNEILNLNLSIEPLLQEAKETKKALMKQLEGLKKTSETVKKLEESGAMPMYT
ncbi:MAG: PAC2 family protein [Candidatus Diapherotrites archaeon]